MGDALRATILATDDAVATAALVVGYPVQCEQSPDGFSYHVPDEAPVRTFVGEALCGSLARVPFDATRWEAAQAHLARVQTAMRITQKRREVVVPDVAPLAPTIVPDALVAHATPPELWPELSHIPATPHLPLSAA